MTVDLQICVHYFKGLREGSVTLVQDLCQLKQLGTFGGWCFVLYCIFVLFCFEGERYSHETF